MEKQSFAGGSTEEVVKKWSPKNLMAERVDMCAPQTSSSFPKTWNENMTLMEVH